MVKGKILKHQNYDSSMNRQNWDDEEIVQLTKAVQKCGMNWLEIAKLMPKRNPNQCVQKWKNIKGSRSRKNRFWTKEEDSLLIQFVGQVGKDWVQIASQMKNRNNRQCRDRYYNTLDPSLKSYDFTTEEDILLYEKFLIFGPKWCQISKELPGRTDNQVKNRFHTHIRTKFFKIKNPYYSKISAEQAKETLERARQNHICLLLQSRQQCHILQGQFDTMEDNISEFLVFSSQANSHYSQDENGL